MARIGKKAPFFKGEAIIRGNIKEISMDDFPEQMIVLFFYPLNFSYVCPTEIIAFNARYRQFQTINVQLIGCSRDSAQQHMIWNNMERRSGGLGNVSVPLLSDRNGKIGRDYGIQNEKFGYNERSMFIIDMKRIVRYISVSDLPIGRSVDETLRLSQAIQISDTYEAGCPANWRPGQDTVTEITEY